MDQGLMGVQTPCYVVDEKRLRENLTILRQVAEEAGCKILLAQKAFSMFAVYPLIGEYLAGTTASGLFEARLGREEFPGEVHVFSPAYREEELDHKIGEYRARYGTNVIKLVSQMPDISATEIREKYQAGEPATGLVPETVERYITEHGLYQRD